MTRPLAIFRTDAGPAIGGGHLMRCRALAEGLAEAGWDCAVAASADVPDADLTLDGLDAGRDRERLEARWPQGCDLLVTDHYRIDAGYERAQRPWARKVMAIDDLADRAHDADLLLDQTPGRAAADYAGLLPAGATVLAGSAYALVRRELVATRRAALKSHAEADPMRRVLVCIGATDPGNWTEVALTGIAQCGADVAADVALSAAAPHGTRVRDGAAAWPMPVTVHLGTADLPALLCAADLGVSGAGVTAAERACLGLPGVALVTVENQAAVGHGLAAEDLDRVVDACALPDRDAVAASIALRLRALIDDSDARRRLSRRAARAYDGLGTRRAVQAIEALCHGPARAADGGAVRLRRAERDDSDMLFRWQNDPATRRFARHPARPSREEHSAWFARKLADPDCLFCIVEHDGAAAGMIRLDRLAGADDEHEVSIAIAPDRHRLGLGRLALRLLRDLVPAWTIRAAVLPGNEASHALFASAGFRRCGDGYVSAPERPIPPRGQAQA